MIVLFPIPGYVAKLVQEVQRTRMKQVIYVYYCSRSVGQFSDRNFILQTDARVQDVTEG